MAAHSHLTFTPQSGAKITFSDELGNEGFLVILSEDTKSAVYVAVTEEVRDDLARIVRDWNFAEEAEARGEVVVL